MGDYSQGARDTVLGKLRTFFSAKTMADGQRENGAASQQCPPVVAGHSAAVEKRLRVAMVACPAWAVWAPNPALMVLSAQLRRKGFHVNLYDLNLDAYRRMVDYQTLWLDENAAKWESEELVGQLFANYREFFVEYIEGIAANEPGLISFSVNSGSRHLSILLSTMVRERLPGVPIIFGGADCFRSEYCRGYMLRGVVDAVCVGEGDIALPALAEALEAEDHIPLLLPGFLTWKGEEIVDNSDPERPTDLDALAPITFEGIDISRYTMPNRLTMTISRGCINRCSFCSESPNFGRFRTHSAEWVIEQLKMVLPRLADDGLKPHINFNDSLINGNVKVLEHLCDLIIAEQLDFSWGGMAYIREEMNIRLLQKMRLAGCVEICWGVESGSAAVLKAMRKRFTPALLERVIHETASAGIAQYGNLIVGFPGEGPKEFAETLLFLIKNIKHFTMVGLPLMVLRRNSPLYETPEKFGIGDVDTDNWYMADGSNTAKIRLLRRGILEQVVNSKKFDLGRDRAPLANAGGDVEIHDEYVRILENFVQSVQSYLDLDHGEVS